MQHLYASWILRRCHRSQRPLVIRSPAGIQTKNHSSDVIAYELEDFIWPKNNIRIYSYFYSLKLLTNVFLFGLKLSFFLHDCKFADNEREASTVLPSNAVCFCS